MKQIVHAITSKVISLLKIYFFKDKKSLAYKRWVQDDGENHLRYDYPITKDSVVFDLGGYKGEFTEKIISKFDCSVYIFEPVDSFYQFIKDKFQNNHKVHVFNFGLSDVSENTEINLASNSSSTFKTGNQIKLIQMVSINEFLHDNNIQNIDLMKINIEGGEYDVLPALIQSGRVKDIKNLQIQFHNFVCNSDIKRDNIIKDLALTHKNTFSYYMIWENWTLKN